MLMDATTNDLRSDFMIDYDCFWIKSVKSFDFRALDAECGHQALLIESEGVDAAVQCLGVDRASHAFVHDDQARGGSDRPSACSVYPIDRLLIHEEKRVAEFLDTCLQSI